jgi:glycosyltransferase involved in cell wall biosynthesis
MESAASARAPRPLVLIPAFNEQDSIGATLSDLAGLDFDVAVLVVDDGSHDHTAMVARAHGARCLQLPYNLGVGAAVRAGLRWAAEQGHTRAVVVDADGQHDAQSIARLLGALDAGADVAVGSRFGAEAPYDVTRLRRGGMRLLAGIVRRLTHLPLTDVTSGFRAFNARAIQYLAREYPVEYLADTVEVLLRCYSAGLRIAEVQVAMRPRAAGKPSSRNVALLVNYLRLLIGIASWRWRHSMQRGAPGAELTGREEAL